MAMENTAGLGVLNSYGPRTVVAGFGAMTSDDQRKVVTVDIDVPSGKGIAAAAWAKTGLDVVIPTGAAFIRADLIVETAFNNLTALTVGTYLASDGTTAVDADGLITAAGSALASIDAAGDRLVGNGAQLATGTAGLGAMTAPVVIRTLYTGSAPTTGKARLVVEYQAPTP